MAIRTLLSLFSGYGGLDLGLQIAIPDSRVVCHVEIEIKAAELLATRIADGCLDEAPIWSDVRTFDCEPWRGRVDCIAGGFPCQDVSVAGKRAGIDGAKTGVWAEMFRCVREIRPQLVFAENVPGLLVPQRDKRGRANGPSGMERVLGDLASVGYDAEWDVFSAREVGASHKRERVFILAYRGRGVCEAGDDVDHATSARPGAGRSSKSEPLRNGARRSEFGGRCDDVADAGCAERWRPEDEETGRSGAGPSDHDCRASGDLADTSIGQLQEPGRGSGQRDGRGPAGEIVADGPSTGLPERRSDSELRECETIERSSFAPAPSADLWRDILRIAPHLAPATQPGVCGLVDGASLVVDEFRTDQLRLLGNGVVPLQAALAFITLARRVR